MSDSIDQGQQDAGTVEDALAAAGELNDAGVPVGHPAWKEILDAVPDEFHHLLTPTLEKWDKGVQQKIQDLHSEFDPFKSVVEDYEPETVAMALNLAEAIQADPAGALAQLQKAYGLSVGVTGEQGVVEDDDAVELDSALEGTDPAIAKQLAEQRALIEELRAERQAEQESITQEQEDAELEQMLATYIEDLHKIHGDFDEDFVITLMGNGVDGVEAVERYQGIIANAAPKVPAGATAPAVLGSGGNIPSGAVDVTKLSPTQTQDYVAQLLAAQDN
jgi:hypothetical protein